MDNIKQLYERLRETPFPEYGKLVGDFVLYDSLLAGCADRFYRGESVCTSEVPVPDEETMFCIRQLQNKKELNKEEFNFLQYFVLLEDIQQALTDVKNEG